MGAFIDIYIEFIFRSIFRFFRARVSKSWPIVAAEATSTSYLPGGFGCAVAEITYQYRLRGELYTGMNTKPFVLDSSAEQYLKEHPTGSRLLLRVNPLTPDVSVVQDRDTSLQSQGYRLEI